MACAVVTSEVCRLCKDSSRECQTLPCGHQLCDDCLQQDTCASAVSSEAISHCPSCREQTEAQHTVGLSEVNESTDDTEQSQANMCTNADHGPATVFCTSCRELYCQSCAVNHQLFKVTKDHTMTPADPATPGKPPIQQVCLGHSKVMSHFCKTCKKLICEACAVRKHRGHWCQELAKAASEAEKEREYIFDESAECIIKSGDALGELAQTEAKICLDFRGARQKMEKGAQRIFDIVNSHKADVVRCLNSHEASVLAKLKSTRQGIEDNKTRAANILQEIEKTRHLDDIKQVSSMPALKDDIDVVNQDTYQKVTWGFDYHLKHPTEESVRKMLGVEDVQMKRTTETTPGHVRLGEPLLQVPLKHVNFSVSGMVVIEDCIYVIHNYERHLWLYDLDSNITKSCEVPELRYPRGMALVSSLTRTLVITDTKDNSGRLHLVKLSPNFGIDSHKVVNTPMKVPERVNVSSTRDHLLIGQYGCSEFAVCTMGGALIKWVQTIDSFCSSKCVIDNKDGYVALMWGTGGKGFLQWVDGEGKCSHSYGHKESEQLNQPTSVIKIGESLIITDNDNNKLQLVDANGRESQLLLTWSEGICQPSSVFYDEQSERLYVAHGLNGSREVRVYRWPPKSGKTETTHFELVVK